VVICKVGGWKVSSRPHFVVYATLMDKHQDMKLVHVSILYGACDCVYRHVFAKYCCTFVLIGFGRMRKYNANFW